MKLHFIAAPIALAAIPFTASAQAIDQEDLVNDTYMAEFGQTDLAQSFQQSASDIDGASVFLYNTGSGTGDVTISLYSNLPNAGGNLLASGTASGVGANQWANVTWSDVSITSGQEYYLVFTSDNSTLGLAGDLTGSYTKGEVYANPGYEGFPGYDYTFITYHATSAPEPVTCSLLGLGALALIRRKR